MRKIKLKYHKKDNGDNVVKFETSYGFVVKAEVVPKCVNNKWVKKSNIIVDRSNIEGDSSPRFRTKSIDKSHKNNSSVLSRIHSIRGL